ncbi:MAG: TonB-dependent receptor [Acidobacteria bacterium]|nr:TonB-dependent receptor [Acidobacteriota bacterium]
MRLPVALFLITLPIYAQFESGVVLGFVKDSTGAGVPNAALKLENIETGVSATAHSAANGDYQFQNIRLGQYRLTAEAPGFSTAVVPNINVAVNARQRVDVTLQVGKLTEQVVVSAAVELLESDSSEKGQVVDAEQIRNLPLNGRAYSDLALLAPGVSESNQNGIGSSAREGSFNVNGLRNTANNFQLDGVDNNAYGTSNQSFSNQVVQVSPDAVAEFKVQTNSYSAEYGRSGGAVINAAYRSGTNRFQGTLWDYNRNTALNATGFFKPASGVKPALRRNQFGMTFGGPIRRDRTFFFSDYEGFRQSQANLVYSTIPTLAHRQGIFTVPVQNPYTGEMYNAGAPVPLTAFARKVLNELPEPNVPGVTSNNYQKSVPNRSVYDKFNLRLDHKHRDSLSGFLRIGQQKSNIFEAPNISGPSGGAQNGVIHVLTQQIAAGVTWIPSARSVFEFRLGISRTEAGKHPPYVGGASMRELYGIIGLPEDRTITGGLTPQSIQGYSALGRQATNPQFQNPTVTNPRVSYTVTLGRQTLKFGAEFLAINTAVQDTNPLYGSDSYNSQFSRPAGRASNNLYNLADFLFGARTQYELATLMVAEMRQRSYFGYVQDDIRVNNRLTLNIGLRYEYVTPFAEASDRLSNFDPSTNTIVKATGSDRSLVNPDRNNFAPRFGFAYKLDNATVVRGGYGMGYVYFNRMGSANLLATNYPQVTRATITQSIRADINGTVGNLPICGTNQYRNCFRPTELGYPAGLPNDVTLYIPRDSRNGYIQNWQLTIQRRLARQTLFEVSYVGNHSVKQVLLVDWNQARPPLPGEIADATLNARRPIQGFGSISAVVPQGFSNYHSLQSRVEHRATRRLNLLNSFTWSKAIDNASQVLEEPNGATGTPQDRYNLAADRGISGYNVPFLNSTSAVWQLPFGRGKSALKSVIGGWQVSLINTMRSGRTVNMRYNTSGPTPVTSGLPTFLGGVTLRPNLIGDPLTPEADRSIDNYFNRTNVVLPTATSPFGNAGRNIVRGYAYYQLNAGVQKDVRLPYRDRMSLQIRAEAFNLLNRTNFGAPNGDRSSGAFGTIRSTYAARQIQFALRLAF